MELASNMEERAVQLASLYLCEISVASEALAQSGGDFDLATQIIFGGSAAASSGAASSSSQPHAGWVDVPTIDLDEDEDVMYEEPGFPMPPELAEVATAVTAAFQEPASEEREQNVNVEQAEDADVEDPKQDEEDLIDDAAPAIPQDSARQKAELDQLQAERDARDAAVFEEMFSDWHDAIQHHNLAAPMPSPSEDLQPEDEELEEAAEEAGSHRLELKKRPAANSEGQDEDNSTTPAARKKRKRKSTSTGTKVAEVNAPKTFKAKVAEVDAPTGCLAAVKKKRGAKRAPWTLLPDSMRGSGNTVFDLWASRILANDPPALRLDARNGSTMGVTVPMYNCADNYYRQFEFTEMPSARVYNYMPSARMYNGHACIPIKMLEDASTATLKNVRYPPSSLDMCWRFHDDHDITKLMPHLTEARAFRLLSNGEDEAAPQPPHFQTHPLRPEQLRSLSWMLSQEGIGNSETDPDQHEFVVEWLRWAPVPSLGKKASMEMKARASYMVRGGILADKIGYGKTATTIGLIDSTLHLPSPDIPSIDSDSFIQAKGTLIIVPPNLLGQWLEEITKFLGATGASGSARVRSGMQVFDLPHVHTRGGHPRRLKIFALWNVAPLTSVSTTELADADIVICTYRLLYSQIYVHRRLCIAATPTDPWASNSLHQLADIMKQWKVGHIGIDSSHPRGENNAFKPPGSAVLRQSRRGEDFSFPLLEMFYWRRCVFDEFHELERMDSAQQNCLQHLRAHARWGLTGTPPVASTSGVIFMSSLFRIDLVGQLEKPGQGHSPYPDLALWESDSLLREIAGKFCDKYIRQNTAELPHIRLEENVKLVHHTAAERALYLGHAHDTPDLDSPDAFSAENIQAMERLLKQCSHFQANGNKKNASESAEEECSRIRERKERLVVIARNQVVHGWQVLKLLMMKADDVQVDFDVNFDDVQAAADTLKKGGGDAGGVVAKEFATLVEQSRSPDYRFIALDALNGYCPRNVELTSKIPTGAYMEWQALLQADIPAASLAHMISTQKQEEIQNLKSMRDALASQDFFQRAVGVLATTGAAADEARSCAVCMEDGLPLERLAITPCAHIFCMPCLKSTIARYRHCSICRQTLSEKDIHPVSAELAPVERSLGCSSSSSSSSSALPAGIKSTATQKSDALGKGHMKYGTKLATLVKTLMEIRAADATAKVILFSQFDDLKHKVASALEEFGIPNVQLQGQTHQRARIIREWQQDATSEKFVLMLSLGQSASGTNLTAANHIMFLHPMLAPSAEQAAHYELQAIGRARRHGQQRDVVHVWRFVTANTIEQDMTARHQSVLWSRMQQPAMETTETAAVAQSSTGLEF